MKKVKRGYKPNAKAGSLCELKPTPATGTFQGICGAFGINVRSVGNDVLMECEYAHTAGMKPTSPHWHQQDDTLIEGLMLL
jgi:hypothetical protein